MSKFFSLDYYILHLLLFSLPFGMGLFTPILFLWLCVVLISYFIKRDYNVDRFKGLLVLPVLFYLVFAIREIVSTGINSSSISDLQLKLSLLIIPILFPYQRKIYQNSNHTFLWLFVAGCGAASIYYIGYAIYRSSSLIGGVLVFNPIPTYGWNNYFLGTEFSYLLHPSYLALYFLVALLFIGKEIKRWWQQSYLHKILVIFSSLLILSSLVMLQSRAGVLGFGLLVMVWFSYLVISKRKYLLGIILITLLLSMTFFVLSKFDRLANTAKSLKTTAELGITEQSKDDGTTIRIWIWKSALSAIKEHPIWGVGTENVRIELQKQYETRGMTASVKERLNAHNQYLETWLGLGIFGLISLLAMLFIPLWIGIKEKNWLLVGFICLCCVSFTFESMLERIAGIAFFSIFYTILVSVGNTKKTLIIESKELESPD